MVTVTFSVAGVYIGVGRVTSITHSFRVVIQGTQRPEPFAAVVPLAAPLKVRTVHFHPCWRVIVPEMLKPARSALATLQEACKEARDS